MTPERLAELRHLATRVGDGACDAADLAEAVEEIDRLRSELAALADRWEAHARTSQVHGDVVRAAEVLVCADDLRAVLGGGE